ncbi:MAG: ATPase, T2SS/T4P/T4SS family [archaeon]
MASRPNQSQAEPGKAGAKPNPNSVPPLESLDELELELSEFQSKLFDAMALEQRISSKGKQKDYLDSFTREYRKGKLNGKNYLNLFQRHAMQKFPDSRAELEILSSQDFVGAANHYNRILEMQGVQGKEIEFRKNPNYRLNSVIMPIARAFSKQKKPGQKQKANPKSGQNAEEKAGERKLKGIAGKLFVVKSEFDEVPVEIRQDIRLPEKKSAMAEQEAVPQQERIGSGYRPSAPKLGKPGGRKTGMQKADSAEEEAKTINELAGQGEVPSMQKVMEKLFSSIFSNTERKAKETAQKAVKGAKQKQPNAGIFNSIKGALYSVATGGEEEGFGLGKVYQPESMTSLRERFFVGGKEHLVSAIQSANPNQMELIPGYSSMQVLKEEAGTNLYYIFEPELSKTDENIIAFVKKKLIEIISLEDLDRETLFEKVDQIIKKKKIRLTDEQRQKLVYYTSRDLFGLGRIEALMHDPFIEDIECDGVGIPIFLVHRKYGHLPTNISYDDISELEDFVIKLAQLSRGYVSYASPLLDAILPDGSRVNAVLSQSVSTKGPTFTIRRFPEEPFSPIHLMEFDTLPASILAYLWTAIEYKKNILITGPTAAGKTTMLNAIAMFFPSGDRVVSIEDTRELNIEHENWLPQVSRRGFGPPDAAGQRFGEITLMDLIKESFRQRPDYLIIGEVRGEETYIMFQGMASGHCCLATMHGRSVDDLVSRLTTPPINLYPSLLNSLDIVLVMGFKGTETIKRALIGVAEIESYNPKTTGFTRLWTQGQRRKNWTSRLPAWCQRQFSLKPKTFPEKDLQVRCNPRLREFPMSFQ